MNFTCKKLDNKISQSFPSIFALDILEGLSNSPKRLYSKYFYDDIGSKLFQEITDLKDYYLTNCEAEILEVNKAKIAKLVPNNSRLIELGAGDGRKTNILLSHFLKQDLQFEYTPVDISSKAMNILMESLQKKFANDGLITQGLIGEYFDAISWLANSDEKTNFVMLLGSNIGNFTLQQARTFLRYLWNSLNDNDYVLIGFDLKKDIKILNAAYNDSQGITKQFNLNILNRINRELGANFNIAKFDHSAHYNVVSGAMESWLINSKKQEVNIKALKKSFIIETWEGIHTEYSYKYTHNDIQGLAKDTGFSIEEMLTDEKTYFMDTIWKVVKE